METITKEIIEKEEQEKKKEKERETNRAFSMTGNFQLACDYAGIKPTTRQASRFKMKKGSLYKKAGSNLAAYIDQVKKSKGEVQGEVQGG